MRKRTKYTFALHHWLGLVAGILILVSSLSGVVLVFDDDIDAALFADKATLAEPAQHLRIDASVARIRQQNPGWDIRVPSLPESADQALRYELRQGLHKKWIFVHPETGAELATINQAHHRLTQLLLDIHYTYLAGLPGKFVVLLVGLSLFILTVTGFMLYRRSIWQVLLFRQKFSFKSRRGLFSGLHRTVGVWALLFNLLMSTSGLVLAYTVLESALKGSPKTITVPPITASVDAALQQVRRQYPGFEVTYLRFPVNAAGQLQLKGRFRSDPVYYGAIYSSVAVNYKTGAVEKTSFLREQPLLSRLPLVLQALHFGDYAGYFVKFLYSFFGLMPGILSISGFLLWKYKQAAQLTTKARKVSA
ncbi:PepSY domain-containing protein [Pontibacter sp. 172403-2]|uniref:PepSY-associated TM helix domain-containing protein n=1 Tax=Pontibacter rufus TaxID=2791028 RepID=UPI0018AF9508|nr:PepSY-associated TM helix domain-containing protein [Pontibacter sp. 172403-2]MBF9252367.1 PepSY domain-containing protein [Pontibacter sp. 172403-2]